MDNFRIIYRILRALEASLDCEEFDPEQISPAALKCSQERRDNLLRLLSEEGYVKDRRITLAGLAYLSESPLMRRSSDLAKGISHC